MLAELLLVGIAVAASPAPLDPREVRILVSWDDQRWFAVPLDVDLPRGALAVTSVCGDPLAGGTTELALGRYRVTEDAALATLHGQVDAATAPCLEPELLRLYQHCPGIRPDPRTVGDEAAAVEALLTEYPAPDLARAVLAAAAYGRCGEGVRDTIGLALTLGWGRAAQGAP